MEPITTKKIGDYLINILRDDNPMDPREDDNLGTMVCFHRRYELGDKNHNYDSNDYNSWGEMREAIEKDEDTLIILPLYLYDHSGITMRTTPFECRWDSGQVGFIYVSKKKVREEYSTKRITQKIVERVRKVLEGEVIDYDKFISGEMCGFQIYKLEECNLGHTHKIHVESSWGYYDEEDCMKEAESIVKHCIEEEQKETVS